MIYSLFYYVAFASMRCMTAPTHESSTINHFMESLELYSSTSMDHLMDTLSKTVFQEDLSSPYHLLAAKKELRGSLEGDLVNPMIQKFAVRADSVLGQARLNKNVDQRGLAEHVSRQLAAEWQSMAKVQVDAWSQKDLNAFMDKHAGVLQEIIRIPYSGNTQKTQELVQETRFVKRGTAPAIGEEVIATVANVLKNSETHLSTAITKEGSGAGEMVASGIQPHTLVENLNGVKDGQIANRWFGTYRDSFWTWMDYYFGEGRWSWVSRTSQSLYRNQPFTKERLTRLLDFQSHWAVLISYTQTATHGFIETTHGMADYFRKYSPGFPRTINLNLGIQNAGTSILQGAEAFAASLARGVGKIGRAGIYEVYSSADHEWVYKEVMNVVQSVAATAGEHAGAHAGANAGTNFAVAMTEQAGKIVKKAGSAVMSFLKPILFITIPLIIIALVYSMLLK